MQAEKDNVRITLQREAAGRRITKGGCYALNISRFFENGQFVSSEPVKKLPEHKKAIVTILDEKMDEDEEMERKLKALDEIEKLLDESMDEEVPDFPRANLHREVEI